MLSIERVKELIGKEVDTLSEDEIKQIRDEFCELAEIIYAQWKEISNKTSSE
ncbi:MAG: hypothetical protein ACYC49_00160 [Ignavibacteriaceae bacterium]